MQFAGILSRAAVIVLALLPITAHAQYIDGLPTASSVGSSDLIPVCQGGTSGHPGTCTTRSATAAQIVTAGGGAGTPGGSSGQLQYNNAGSFGGFTAGGDATIVPSTGQVTVSKIGGMSVSLGGAFTTSGAHTLTFTLGGNTTLTLPASGMLLTATGSGVGLTGLTYSQLPALSANTLLGALTATTPSGIPVPSCSGGSNALNYTLGTGFSCNTISGGSATSVTVGNTTIGSGTSGSLLYDNAGTLGNQTLSTAIDAALGSAQGDILYRGASGWAALAPGTAGNVLSTGGASANPAWVAQSGGGSGTVNSGTANQLAYYSASGTVVSGLATSNSGVLVTSSGGAPSVSTTLPNGLAMGTPASATLTNGTGLPVGGISATGTPSSATYLRGDGTWSTPSGGSGSSTLTRATHTAAYTTVAGDVATVQNLSGTFAYTLTAPATLGNGWWQYVENNSTGTITLTPASGTIDGAASYPMYAGEVRLVQTDGTNFYTTIIQPFTLSLLTTTTITIPPGYARFQGYVWGAGGGGFSGASAAAYGGGGGAGLPFDVAASGSWAPANSVTCTVAAGGAAGAVGGNTTLASLMSYGGAGGTASAGGGGGGVQGAGSGSTGGAPLGGSSGVPSTFGGGGNNGSSVYGGGGGSGGNGGASQHGGGGGGGSTGTTPYSGGVSLFGGSGGAGAISGTASAGQQPGGGGGGSYGGTGGAGGAGACLIRGII